MKRRTLLKAIGAGTAGALAAPAYARADSQTTLKFIPQIDLAFLDPVATSAYVTRNHGYMVWDTLYGQDGNFEYQPQMVAGHTIENDGKLWKLTLRDGLVFHDGTPVLAKDCVASIKRWARRDAFGGTLMAATDEVSALDDKTIQFKLKKPFPLLPAALGHVPNNMCAMMPERLALTDPFKPITEIIGSGPFRFLANERVPGSRNVYAKFDKYVPRQGGKADWTSGPKVVNFDRVEWTTIPDAATASSALQNGEQDWWELALVDLVPQLSKNAKIRVATQDPTGLVQMMRPNFLHPPFNNPEFRRALLFAMSQQDFMESIVGPDPKAYHVPMGTFCPGTPMANEAGLAPLLGKRDLARAKQMIKDSGYKGEKVVMMVPTDYTDLKANADVAAELMRQLGINVDYVAMDWGTMLARRAKKDPPDQGGWSVFFTGQSGADMLSPATHVPVRGNGDQPSGWPGWSTIPEIETLRTAWFDAPDEAAQKKICAQIQESAMTNVPYYPLGQYYTRTAYRSNLTGVLNGFATFWNVKRA